MARVEEREGEGGWKEEGNGGGDGETLHEREVNVSTWALQACGQIGNPTGPIAVYVCKNAVPALCPQFKVTT